MAESSKGKETACICVAVCVRVYAYKCVVLLWAQVVAANNEAQTKKY